MTTAIAAPPAAPVIGYTIVDSPLGRLLVAATARGICTVRLGESDEALETDLAVEHPGAELRRDGDPLALWVNALLRHLAGEQPRLDLPLDVRATAFQGRVWTALRAIPYGATRSYGEIAHAIGRPGAERAVARACATNPVALVIPCHRVVRHDGAAGGYRWGVRRKRLLLEQERAAAQRAERAVLRAFVDDAGVPPADAVPGAELAPGDVVAGRYEVLGALGAGGMGVVYAARDRELNEVIALKVLRAPPPSGTEDPAALDRFRRELRITRRLSHPNVVRTHDIGAAGDRGGRFITMEYVDGWSLAQLLEHRGTLPVPVVFVLGKQLCRALAAVHSHGVIHRDIKPQNVLIGREGDVKLTDFGIAQLEHPAAREHAGRGADGTLPYMAPEQILGEALDARTDLYATAAVLYECLTGRPPYLGRDWDPGLSGHLAVLLRGALSADPTARPADAAALHDALTAVEWSTAGPMLEGVTA